MVSDNQAKKKKKTKKKTDSVRDSSKSATRHNNGKGKQKSTSGRKTGKYHEKSQLYDIPQDHWLHWFIGSSCEVACQKISLVQSVLLFVWQKKIYKHIFHKNMFNPLNKWLHVNLVGGSIYSNVHDLNNNDLCISSELTCT